MDLTVFLEGAEVRSAEGFSLGLYYHDKSNLAGHPRGARHGRPAGRGAGRSLAHGHLQAADRRQRRQLQAQLQVRHLPGLGGRGRSGSFALSDPFLHHLEPHLLLPGPVGLQAEGAPRRRPEGRGQAPRRPPPRGGRGADRRAPAGRPSARDLHAQPGLRLPPPERRLRSQRPGGREVRRQPGVVSGARPAGGGRRGQPPAPCERRSGSWAASARARGGGPSLTDFFLSTGGCNFNFPSCKKKVPHPVITGVYNWNLQQPSQRLLELERPRDRRARPVLDPHRPVERQLQEQVGRPLGGLPTSRTPPAGSTPRAPACGRRRAPGRSRPGPRGRRRRSPGGRRPPASRRRRRRPEDPGRRPARPTAASGVAAGRRSSSSGWRPRSRARPPRAAGPRGRPPVERRVGPGTVHVPPLARGRQDRVVLGRPRRPRKGTRQGPVITTRPACSGRLGEGARGAVQLRRRTDSAHRLGPTSLSAAPRSRSGASTGWGPR